MRNTRRVESWLYPSLMDCEMPLRQRPPPPQSEMDVEGSSVWGEEAAAEDDLDYVDHAIEMWLGTAKRVRETGYCDL